jgi:pantetheine-phosphate adenylyltransferase
MKIYKMEKIAIFPGSFDPYTIGHDSIIKKSLHLFDKVIIAIGNNSEKKTIYYSIEERIDLISKLYSHQTRISVQQYDCLTIDFCKKVKAKFIIRGIRNVIDFEYEKSLAQTNSVLDPEIETIFFLANQDFSAVNSSILRDILTHNGDISKFLP